MVRIIQLRKSIIQVSVTTKPLAYNKMHRIANRLNERVDKSRPINRKHYTYIAFGQVKQDISIIRHRYQPADADDALGLSRGQSDKRSK